VEKRKSKNAAHLSPANDCGLPDSDSSAAKMLFCLIISAWVGLALTAGPSGAQETQPASGLLQSNDLSAWKEPTHAWSIVGDVSLSPTNEKMLVSKGGTGILFNNGRTPDILSRQQFGDVEAHVEFMISKASNSGVYFMGSYELQIYDSFGVKHDRYPGIECGGLYPRWIDNKNVEGHSPNINASLPPGQWQTFDVIFRAPKFNAKGEKIANAVFVKVIHNGKVIHENVELKGETRGGFPEHAQGPLRLQGDHGPVAFRNITIRPLAEQAQ